MKKALLILLIAFIGIAAVNLWFAWRSPPPVAERQPLPDPGENTGIRYPIPTGEVEEALPELEKSDGRMREILARLFPKERLERFFVLEHFIQRFVVTVDNLPRHDLPVNRLPMRPLSSGFLVLREDGLVIDPANYRRYTPYIRLVEGVDPGEVVKVYVQFYPLFQKAYESLGYPSGYFNDRLVEVIDHLLATPEVSGPIRLVRPKVRYHFADPDLEALSCGRKILIRMGPENAARVKALLRMYRRELAPEGN